MFTGMQYVEMTNGILIPNLTECYMMAYVNKMKSNVKRNK